MTAPIVEDGKYWIVAFVVFHNFQKIFKPILYAVGNEKHLVLGALPHTWSFSNPLQFDQLVDQLKHIAKKVFLGSSNSPTNLQMSATILYLLTEHHQ